MDNRKAHLKKGKELTGWYRCASAHPVRAGLYEVRGPMIETGTLMHWNGRFWGAWHQNPFGRGNHYIDHGFGSQPGDAWRGMSQPQSARPSR